MFESCLVTLDLRALGFMRWLLGHLLGFSPTERPSSSHLWRPGVIPLVLLAAFRLCFRTALGVRHNYHSHFAKKNGLCGTELDRKAGFITLTTNGPSLVLRGGLGGCRGQAGGDLGAPNLPNLEQITCKMPFYFSIQQIQSSNFHTSGIF